MKNNIFWSEIGSGFENLAAPLPQKKIRNLCLLAQSLLAGLEAETICTGAGHVVQVSRSYYYATSSTTYYSVGWVTAGL